MGGVCLLVVFCGFSSVLNPLQEMSGGAWAEQTHPF